MTENKADKTEAVSRTGTEKRVLIFATTAYMIERFNMMNIKLLQDMGYTVDAACNFEFGNPMSSESLEHFRAELKALKVEAIQIPVNRRIYDIANNGQALIKTVGLLRKRHYSFVHCHTPVGSVVARLACRLTGTKVIYTAHGFHFFDGAPRINWLLYYPVEKLFSYMTDVLITINREDYDRAKAKFHMKHLEYVPGVGIDTDKFAMSRDESDCNIGCLSYNENDTEGSIEANHGTEYPKEKTDLSVRVLVRRELQIADDARMILMVGELSKRKNHISVLKAMAEIEAEHRLCICIAGTGAYRETLEKYIEEKHLQDKIKLLGYREDTLRLYQAADAFLFPSYQEGLSAALMEAMACGLPVAASRIRGNTDLVDSDGGMLFDVGREPKHIEDESESVPHIREALRWLSSLSDEELSLLGKHNYGKIREGFGLDKVRERLHEIYSGMQN